MEIPNLYSIKIKSNIYICNEKSPNFVLTKIFLTICIYTFQKTYLKYVREIFKKISKNMFLSKILNKYIDF